MLLTYHIADWTNNTASHVMYILDKELISH
jgi:hypothetical protein